MGLHGMEQRKTVGRAAGTAGGCNSLGRDTICAGAAGGEEPGPGRRSPGAAPAAGAHEWVARDQRREVLPGAGLAPRMSRGHKYQLRGVSSSENGGCGWRGCPGAAARRGCVRSKKNEGAKKTEGRKKEVMGGQSFA